MRRTALLALALTCLACQGCFLTSSLWARDTVHVDRSEQVLLGSELEPGVTPAGEQHLRLTVQDRVTTDQAEPVLAGDSHLATILVPTTLAVVIDPFAELGAGAPRVVHLERLHDGERWNLHLQVDGHAPRSAFGYELAAETVPALAPGHRLAQAELTRSIEAHELRRLVRLLVPTAADAPIIPRAWAHADLSVDADPPARLTASSVLEVIDQRLLVELPGTTPRWIAITGPALILAGHGDWWVEGEGENLGWRLEAECRAHLAPGIPEHPADAGDAIWVTVHARYRERRPHSAIGILGRVVATPVTVAADTVLVIGGTVIALTLLPIMLSGP